MSGLSALTHHVSNGDLDRALGTPPEDDAGAGEAPATATTDSASKNRTSGLAARIDAYLADDEDGDDAPPPPKPRLQSEPSIDIPIEEDEPHRLQSAPSILVDDGIPQAIDSPQSDRSDDEPKPESKSARVRL